MSSKPAKAAETTEAAVQKSLTQKQENIQRSSRQNDESKTAKASPLIKTMFQKGPGLMSGISNWIILMKTKLSTNSLTFILNLQDWCIMSVSKKLGQSTVVYCYCALSQFFWNSRYLHSSSNTFIK